VLSATVTRIENCQTTFIRVKHHQNPIGAAYANLAKLYSTITNRKSK